MKEQDLVRQILDYLNLKGHFAWRNNTGAFKNSKDQFFRFGLKGSADILGISKDGKFIAVECKQPGKKPTFFQEQFLAQVNDRKGIAIVAFALEDVQVYL